ncbi:MAG: SLC13 family permease [Pseudomonadota bacterium]
MSFSLSVSIAVFLAIAVRQWLPDWVKIWQIMGVGALLVLATGSLTPVEALAAIDWNVIAYLFGVFAISHALFASGISSTISNWICAPSHNNLFMLLVFTLFITVVAAVLTNDAAAAIGTPMALALAARLGISVSMPLIALCVIVTVGSMFSPVGNPQNLLIVADGHFDNPVATFLLWLAVPGILSLAFTLFWFWYRLEREPRKARTKAAAPTNKPIQATPAIIATALLCALVILDSFAGGTSWFPNLPLGALSMLAALVLFALSSNRVDIIKGVDWHTLVFFLAMFIVTGAVLKSGVLQEWLSPWRHQLDEPLLLSAITFWGSQLFSNVPLVEIYLNLLEKHDTAALMLLSGISTLAGNLFIISAASNVIIVQQAEKYGAKPFQFWQFTLAVLPITVVSLALCYGWVALMRAWTN